jgi:serine/threonine protein kinase
MSVCEPQISLNHNLHTEFQNIESQLEVQPLLGRAQLQFQSPLQLESPSAQLESPSVQLESPSSDCISPEPFAAIPWTPVLNGSMQSSLSRGSSSVSGFEDGNTNGLENLTPDEPDKEIDEFDGLAPLDVIAQPQISSYSDDDDDVSSMSDGESRYEKQGKELGHGCYGYVQLARDTVTGERVAIKHVSDLFDSADMAKRILREVLILRLLSGHPNVVHFHGLLPLSSHDTQESFNHIDMVLEYVQTDLHKLLDGPPPLSLTEKGAASLLQQLLSGVAHLHRYGIIHRDIKPANLLVNCGPSQDEYQLKVCDFGLARHYTQQHQQRRPTVGKRRARDLVAAGGGEPLDLPTPCEMSRSLSNPLAPPRLEKALTKHVVTRYYRAPEVILNALNKDTNGGFYGTAIDLWSVGCVMSELFDCVPAYTTRKPPPPPPSPPPSPSSSSSSSSDQPASSATPPFAPPASPDSPASPLPPIVLARKKRPKPLFYGQTCFPLSRGDESPNSTLESRSDMLNLIFSFIGTPTPEDLQCVLDKPAANYLAGLEPKPPADMTQRWPGCPPSGLDLMRALLCFDPARRPKAVDALQFSFFVHTNVGRPTADACESNDQELQAAAQCFTFDAGKTDSRRIRALLFQQLEEAERKEAQEREQKRRRVS